MTDKRNQCNRSDRITLQLPSHFLHLSSIFSFRHITLFEMRHLCLLAAGSSVNDRDIKKGYIRQFKQFFLLFPIPFPFITGVQFCQENNIFKNCHYHHHNTKLVFNHDLSHEIISIKRNIKQSQMQSRQFFKNATFI